MAHNTWRGHCELCGKVLRGNLAHWHHLMGHQRRGELGELEPSRFRTGPGRSGWSLGELAWAAAKAKRETR
ncbi:hypothetical protein CMI37_20435 [Candidatus Pacearchaeota archaeon]|nr:hypothetical protein [Candidatus Pacearchaeota archaeon]